MPGGIEHLTEKVVLSHANQVVLELETASGLQCAEVAVCNALPIHRIKCAKDEHLEVVLLSD